MNETVLKQVVETLISVARDQQLQIQGIRDLLKTFRSAFDTSLEGKIGESVHQSAVQEVGKPPYRDETTERLDELLRQLQKS